MMTVWKTQIDVKPGVHDIAVPSGAELLCVREQHNKVAVWFWCDADQPPLSRKVALCETNSGAPTFDTGRYIGTVLFVGGSYCLHAFEQKDSS